jgi:hypothetical protein
MLSSQAKCSAVDKTLRFKAHGGAERSVLLESFGLFVVWIALLAENVIGLEAFATML